MANQNDPKKAVEEVVQAHRPGVSKEDLRDIIEAVLPAAVAAVSAGNSNARQRQIEQQLASQKKCFECGQLEAACKKQHMKMVVFVDGPYSRWFQGCKLNGVTYLSRNGADAITVPAENEFGHQISLFLKSEERFQTGRVFEHNSGSIGLGNSSGFVPNHGPRY